MAVKFDSSGDAAIWVTTGLIGQSIESFCVAGFGYIDSNNGSANQTLVVGSHDGVASSAGLVWRGSADNMYIYTIGSSTAFASRPALNTPFFWYLQCAGSGSNQLTGGWSAIDGSAFVTQQTTLAGAAAGGTIASLAFGTNGAVHLSGQLAGLRAYTTTLSAAEFEQEQYTLWPAKLASLAAFFPLWDAATYRTDFSGNGANFDDPTTYGLTNPSDGDAGFPIRIRPRRSGRMIFAPAAGGGGPVPKLAAFGGKIMSSGGKLLRIA